MNGEKVSEYIIEFIGWAVLVSDNWNIFSPSSFTCHRKKKIKIRRIDETKNHQKSIIHQKLFSRLFESSPPPKSKKNLTNTSLESWMLSQLSSLSGEESFRWSLCKLICFGKLKQIKEDNFIAVWVLCTFLRSLL